MTVSRRQFLAASAGAAWTVPTVLSVSRAHAAGLNSRPSTQPRPKGTLPQMGPPLPEKLPGLLAYTGQNTEREVEVAAAAVVAGAVMWVANRTPKRVIE